MPATPRATTDTADVYTAIAHPARRRILDMLAAQDKSVMSLAEAFAAEMSRSAVSQHLKILLDSGLVDVHKNGREHYYQLRPENLNQIYHWVKQYEQHWAEKLDALGAFLDETAGKGGDDAA
jgi:DNA-binding transcriptional ArsR family regulator